MNFIRLAHRARARVRSLLTIDKASSADSILLAGSARSGTTWVERFLNPDGTARIVFEPFSPKRVPILRGWPERPYLPPGEEGAMWVDPALRMLMGDVHNWWVDQYNRAYRPKGRIIKEVRAQLMLKWIRTRFPEIPIVLLLRHPFAVACSRMAQGWGDELEELLCREDLVRDHLQGVEGFLKTLSDPFARQVAFWCVENGVALRMLEPGDAHIVFYEQCVRDPQKEFQRLNAFLGRPEALLSEQSILKKSPTARKYGASTQRLNPLQAWEATLTGQEVTRGLEVLRRFGLDTVYGDTPTPLRDSDALLRMFPDRVPG